MIKNIFYKNKLLFGLLKIYWLFIYFLKILNDHKKFYILTKSQNKNIESSVLGSLIPYVESKTFVEIGFHFREFNSVDLIKNDLYGKLVDTSKYDYFNILFSKFIFKNILKKKIDILDLHVKPENVISIFDDKLGFLSLDIDGNDYWILKKILENHIYPEVIMVEYNASLLKNPITTPYLEEFDYDDKIKKLCYYGASLTAMDKLLSKYNYNLVKSIAGVNALFLNDKIFKRANFKKLDPLEVNQECTSKNKIFKNKSKDQYDLVKHLPFIEI